MHYDISTICAIATSGSGAIAIIRLSGPDAYPILEKTFHPASKGLNLASAKANTIHFGTIMDGETIIDEVLVSLFRSPHSYTGEDVSEISCHGSTYIQQKSMELLKNHGAVPAKAGEFTQRAFLNGKMDLSQAEAVADLIASESAASHAVAMQQIRGGFSEKIKELRGRLLNFISLIELELDFSEEDVEFADRKQVSGLIDEIYVLVSELMNSFQLGNVLKNGVPVAIVGRPNVGKSTLLNAILNEDRAIVSDIEGTTRDSIEDTFSIGGVLFRFIDTAGIRETADTIENLGIRRTYQKIEQASIVLLLSEVSDDLDIIQRSVEAIRKQLTVGSQQSAVGSQQSAVGSQQSAVGSKQSAVGSKQLADESQKSKVESEELSVEGKSGKQLVVVLNKSDRSNDAKVKEIIENIQLRKQEHVIAISAEKRENIEKLNDLLLEIVNIGSIRHQDIVISNVRHYNALRAASESLERVRDGLGSALTTDLLAQDIREALHYLGEITGEVTTDEILGNIFKNFCIGK